MHKTYQFQSSKQTKTQTNEVIFRSALNQDISKMLNMRDLTVPIFIFLAFAPLVRCGLTAIEYIATVSSYFSFKNIFVLTHFTCFSKGN